MHFLSAEDITHSLIGKIVRTARFFEKHPISPFTQEIMGSLFFEPSLRTRWSFEAAMIKLGGHVVSEGAATSGSSCAKGETLSDTLRVASGYVTILVVRHPKKNVIAKAAKSSLVPVINAGDGDGEHPTQALLDIYTMLSYFDDLNSKRIAFCGDPLRSRTVNSLKDTIDRLYPECISEIIDVSKEEEFVKDIRGYDVVYMTRFQKERGPNRGRSSLVLDKELVSKMKDNAIILHPLPRNNEVLEEVDTDKRAKYFEQAQNGLYVRMALLCHLLGYSLGD